MATPAQLCKRCRIVIVKRQDGERNCHHRDLASLRLSSHAECPICTWLMMQVETRLDTASKSGSSNNMSTMADKYFDLPLTALMHRSERGIYGTDGEDGMRDELELLFGIHLSKVSEESYDGNGISVLLTPLNAASASEASKPSSHSGSDTTLALAATWLKQCDSEHQCHVKPDGGYRPSRLIGIREEVEGSVQASVQEALHDVEYATLSHRWLEDDAVRLTRHNHEQYRRRIPVHLLKATIRDALRIVLHLGLRYLWVDSLCMIQDDVDDRSREVASMDQIYGNSYCNIMAGSSETQEEGCFFHRDIRRLSAYVVDLQFGNTTPNTPQLHMVRLGNVWRQEEPGHCLLSQRAWVHQERFLPQRALHFLRSQVFWECQHHAATETYPEGNINTTIGLKNMDPATKFCLDYGSNELGYAWALEVLQYTQLHMTFENDRLRALDGIAGRLSRKTRDNYVYGLWESTFPRSLAWQRATEAKQKRLSDLAPSWSWASITGPVNFGTVNAMKPDGSVVVAEMVGRVDPRFPPRHLDRGPPSEGFEHQSDGRELRIKGRPWEGFLVQMHETLLALIPLTKRFCFEHADGRPVVTLDISQEKALEDVLCLPLFVTPGYRGYNVVGLILTQSSTGPFYRRLGVFKRNLPGPEQSQHPKMPFHGQWYAEHDEERELVLC